MAVPPVPVPPVMSPGLLPVPPFPVGAVPPELGIPTTPPPTPGVAVVPLVAPFADEPPLSAPVECEPPVPLAGVAGVSFSSPGMSGNGFKMQPAGAAAKRRTIARLRRMALCQVEHVPGHEPSAKNARFCDLAQAEPGTSWRRTRHDSRTERAEFRGDFGAGVARAPRVQERGRDRERALRGRAERRRARPRAPRAPRRSP